MVHLLGGWLSVEFTEERKGDRYRCSYSCTGEPFREYLIIGSTSRSLAEKSAVDPCTEDGCDAATGCTHVDVECIP